MQSPERTKLIGQRLRQVRNEQGLTLDQLSERTGGALLKARMSNYEQGIRRMGLEEAETLAKVLKVSPVWLLAIDDASWRSA
ncbi:helix-turn-helix domain-containing protein [Thiorhodococcus fuscus]|uniref:Helix-turn-helix domain-containing protein n=1 Tax=Thiorhodococcus fuscus TaxID=527200 RepID=A0ABW4YAT4_9GAMM